MEGDEYGGELPQEEDLAMDTDTPAATAATGEPSEDPENVPSCRRPSGAGRPPLGAGRGGRGGRGGGGWGGRGPTSRPRRPRQSGGRGRLAPRAAGGAGPALGRGRGRGGEGAGHSREAGAPAGGWAHFPAKRAWRRWAFSASVSVGSAWIRFTCSIRDAIFSFAASCSPCCSPPPAGSGATSAAAD